MSKIISGYVADWDADSLIASDAKKMDIVNYAFATISNGRAVESWIHVDKLLAFRSNNPDLKVLVSIGGWAADGFSQLAATASGREVFANSAIQLMLKYDFDGIDIDWEYPGLSVSGIASSPEDKYNFTLMMEEIRAQLDVLGTQNDKKYLLTMAVGSDDSVLRNLEVAKLSNIVDYANLMTYDFAMGLELLTQRYQTNLYSEPVIAKRSVDNTVKRYIEAGMHKKKIMIGAAFYGYGLTNVNIWENNMAVMLGQTARSLQYTYTRIYNELIVEKGYKRYWDSIAKAPWLYNGNTYFTYDDSESIKYKGKYVWSKDIAGMMFWEYSQDKTHTLLEAMYRELK